MLFTDISIYERIGKRNANFIASITLGLLVLLLLFKLPFIAEIPQNADSENVIIALGFPNEMNVSEVSLAASGGNQSNASDNKMQSSVAANSSSITTKNEEPIAAKETPIIVNSIAPIDEGIAKATAKKKFDDIFSNTNRKGNSKGIGLVDNRGNTDNIAPGPKADIARKIRSKLNPSNNYNSSGTVVVAICALEDGSVEIDKVTVKTKGTTTNDNRLREIAIENAKSYKFEKGTGTDCGTITYTFKVK
jgi:hypothetical protein